MRRLPLLVEMVLVKITLLKEIQHTLDKRKG